MAKSGSKYGIRVEDIPVSQYLVIKTEVLPDVYTNVMRVKALLQSGDVDSVNEAVQLVGMSRSAFYKYRDFVRSYQDPHESDPVTIIASFLLESDALSSILLLLNDEGAKLLNISQSLPRHGFVDLMLSVDFSDAEIDRVRLRRQISRIAGVRHVDFLANEDD
jgi:chorismate mutase